MIDKPLCQCLKFGMDFFNANANKPKKKLVDLKAVAALLDEDMDNNVTMLPKNHSHTSFTTNEELIQETARIKKQRDLIVQRISKMEVNRDKVTKGVFEKVARDYTLQLGAISELLTEKKSLLQKEMKALYNVKEKQIVDTNRHCEILEEAKFRHYLEEFTDEQYREVEEYETREINRLQAEMARLNDVIKVHEELFDPEDLGRSSVATSNLSSPSGSIPKFSAQKMSEATNPSFDTDATKTYVYKTTEPAPISPRVSTAPIAPPTPVPAAVEKPFSPPTPVLENIHKTEAIHVPAVKMNAPLAEFRADTDSNIKLEEPLAAPLSEPAIVPEPSAASEIPFVESATMPPHSNDLGLSSMASFEVKKPQETALSPAGTPSPEEKTGHYQLDLNANYFQDLSEPSMPLPPTAGKEEQRVETDEDSFQSSTVIKSDPSETAPPAPTAAKTSSSDDGLLDALSDIPLEESVSQPQPKPQETSMTDVKPMSGQQVFSSPASPVSAAADTGKYKMIFIEGETQASDLVLQDNVSIGRSPSNDLVLNAPKVSRQHAAINKYKDKYIIIDLKSSNGVYINGKKIEEHPLEDGDEVSIAGYRFLFKKI